MSRLFNNTILYIRFLLKKERLYLLAYLFIVTFLVLSQASSFSELYPSAVEREIGANSMNNPAMVAILGPVYKDEGNFTLGALLVNQTILFTSIVSAIFNIILVTRNTRSEEETGRLEIIKSYPFGKLTDYASLFLVIFFINFLSFITIGFGLLLLNIDGISLKGSLLFSAIISSTGVFFASISVLFSNLFDSSRNVYSSSFMVLGLSYLIRAIGDLNKNNLSFFSPLGWVLKSRAFTGNNYLYFILLLILSIFIFVVSLYLYLKRDMGDYIFKNKRKKENNSFLLTTPTGLILKLLTTGFVFWTIFIVVLAGSYGYLLSDIDSFMSSISYLALQSSNTDSIKQFIATIFPLMSAISLIPVIITMLYSVSEEKSGRLEIVLSKKIGKAFPLLNLIFIGVIQTLIVQILFALFFWLTGNSTLPEGLSYYMVTKASLMFVPTFGLFISISSLLVAVAPRLINTIWIYYGFCVFMMLFGETLDISRPIRKLSPFEWIGNYPIDSIEIEPLVAILFISFVLVLISIIFYIKRDKLRSI